jgi:hypothetical protein
LRTRIGKTVYFRVPSSAPSSGYEGKQNDLKEGCLVTQETDQLHCYLGPKKWIIYNKQLSISQILKEIIGLTW